MKHFFTRLIIFLTPIAGLLLLIIGSAIYIGDAIPIPVMVSWQQNASNPIVYQPWNFSNIADYKLETIRQTQPSLLILGSSRMTYFRSTIANIDEAQFYNGALSGTQQQHWYSLLEAVITNNQTPDVIILGLDITNYNGDANPGFNNVRPAELSTIDNLKYIYASLRRTGQYWVTDTGDMMSYIQSSHQENLSLLGLQVLTSERGFYPDGSRYIEDIDDATLATIIEGISNDFEEGNLPFIEGQSVSTEALTITEDILRLAEEHYISIIAILPPFRPSYYERMIESGDFDYIPDALLELQALFGEYDVPLYDFTNPQVIGGSEAEMTDGWHITDLLSLRIYHHLLLEEPELLGQYSDVDTIATWIEQNQERSLEFFTLDLP